MGFTEPLLARAVFTRSNKVPGWQPGAPKIRGHDLPKKILIFLKFIGPVTTLWVLQSSQIAQMVFKEFLLARAVFTRLIRVLGWQPETPKLREHDFPEKTSYFFEIHRTSDTSMGSLSLSNHACGLYGTFASQGSVSKVNYSVWMLARGLKTPGARFSEKNVLFL